MSKVLLTALVGTAALAAAPARAQLQFTLTPASQTYAAGTTATWAATVTNIGATPLTLSGISFTGLPTGLTADDSLYFANFDNVILTVGGAGSSVTANMFTTTSLNSLAPGTYNSTVTVQYTGGTPSPADATATLTSIVTAAAIPEPSSAAFVLLAVPGLALVRRRRS
jgi:hypothetical protein